MENLGDHEHGDALPDADAAHPVSALRELTEHHVLSEGEGRARGERVLDVHDRRVDLVVEGKPLLEADAALRELEQGCGGLRRRSTLVNAPIRVHNRIECQSL